MVSSGSGSPFAQDPPVGDRGGGSPQGESRAGNPRRGGSRHGSVGAGDLKLLALLLAVVLIVVAALGYFGAPFLEAATTALAPGMGLKTGILWGFGVTVTLFVLFALVSGDGLFGELPFMLSAFFLFFAVFSLLITWIF